MASPLDPGARWVMVESAAQWRAWLAEHHDGPTGVWLVRWKPATGKPSPGYDEVIEECLAFGWIDGQAAPMDAERSALWCTRRRRGSGWSRLSKERLARVVASGRLTPAGQAVVDAAKADGSWTLLDSVEALEVPADLAAALAASPGAQEAFDGFGPGVRKLNLRWLVEAKRPETRAARVAEVARMAALGQPARR